MERKGRKNELADPQLPAILLDKCSESPYSVVRYNAFRLLESLNGPEYKLSLIHISEPTRPY